MRNRCKVVAVFFGEDKFTVRVMGMVPKVAGHARKIKRLRLERVWMGMWRWVICLHEYLRL